MGDILRFGSITGQIRECLLTYWEIEVLLIWGWRRERRWKMLCFVLGEGGDIESVC